MYRQYSGKYYNDLHPDTAMAIDEGKPNEFGAMGTDVRTCHGGVVQYIEQHCPSDVAMESARVSRVLF